MSEGYFQQQPIATWNSARGVWEKPGMANLFCEHWGLFSETWPTSGMTLGGKVFGLPTREHLTTGSESLLLRSPKASEGSGGALGEAEALRRGNTVGVRDQVMDLVAGQGLKVSRQADNLLPTPVTTDAAGARNATANRSNPDSQHHSGTTLTDALLPTVTTQDGKNNGGPSQADRNTPPPEFHSIILFPTPVAAEGLKAPAQQNSKTKSKTGQVWLSNIAKDIEEANEQPTTNT